MFNDASAPLQYSELLIRIISQKQSKEKQKGPC